MKTYIATTILSLIFINTSFAQLSPPGLGESNTAFWSAFGVKQRLSNKNSSTTYIGVGRISGENDDNPFNKPSIVVLNEEFYHKLNTHFTYTAAISYRRQYDYGEIEVDNTPVKQEFRIYGRFQYAVTAGNFKWTSTLRQEARKFFNAEFNPVPEKFQLRTRLKTQLLVPIDADAHNSILGSAEALFSVSNDAEDGWNDPSYKESRFCLYYSYSPGSIPVTFDVGYMNDLIGHGHHITDVSYIAFDVIIKNPFSS